MKSRTVFFILISGFLMSFCYLCSVQKNLAGHWVSEKYLIDFNPGDTIRLTKRKFSTDLYQWGSGIASGYTFSENGDFSEYNNVLCSSETDPVQYPDEHWQFHAPDTLIISGQQRTIRYRMLQSPFARKKTLLLKLIETHSNP
ncbi:MAG TPA: hypothetical protein VFJ43_01245 [Bacteroidia bacterium]|nr:hypothetical protein [Bacteroidia bacterium]